MSFSYFYCNLKMVCKHLDEGKQQPFDMQQNLHNYSSGSTLMEIEFHYIRRGEDLQSQYTRLCLASNGLQCLD